MRNLPGELKRRIPASVRSAGPQESPPPETPSEEPVREAPRNVAASVIAIVIPALVAAIGAVAVVLWLRVEPEIRDIKPRLPEAAPMARGPSAPPPNAQTGPGASQPAENALVEATNSPGANASSNTATDSPAASSPPAFVAPNLPGAWPRFRGPKGDNISTETTPLATNWGPQGPKKLWSVALGEGYAGPAVLNGKVYVLDYDQTARADTLRCFSLADGRELWTQSYPVMVKRNHGMSRTVPAVTSKYVVTLGPKCHVLCADAATGSVHWKMDLVAQYGTKVPTWYAGQCPLIEGDKVILAPGGKALVIAVDLGSGRVVWETPNPKGWKMTHSSLAPMTFAGERMYVYCASGGVVGVSAKDGAMLWETSEWTVSTANIPMPLPIGDGRIFLCGGYNSGAMMIRLKQAGGKIAPETLYRLKANVFGSDQQTPILYKGHIYGVIPNKQLACLDLSGKRLWTSGSTNRFGLGPYLIAGGMIYALGDKGDLALAKATPTGYEQLAKAKVLSGHDAWGPLAIVGGRLLARDLTTMVCLDVSKS